MKRNNSSLPRAFIVAAGLLALTPILATPALAQPTASTTPDLLAQSSPQDTAARLADLERRVRELEERLATRESRRAAADDPLVRPGEGNVIQQLQEMEDTFAERIWREQSYGGN